MIYWEYRIETPEPGLMRPRMKNQGDEIKSQNGHCIC